MAQARSVYRQLLRTALLMPDKHRTNLVVFRARYAGCVSLPSQVFGKS